MQFSDIIRAFARVTAPRAGVMSISPKMAKEFLANSNKTAGSSAILQQIVSELLAGQFRCNGDPILIGADGRVQNGCKRLTASVRADLPIEVVFIRDIADDTAGTQDARHRRTMGHVYATKGFPNPKVLAKAAPLIASFKEGVWKERRGMSRAETLAVMTWNNEIVDSLSTAAKLSARIRGLRPYDAVTLHFLLTRTDARQASLFFEDMLDHAKIAPDASIAAALGQILHTCNSPDSRLRSSEVMALAVTAWNRFCADDKKKGLTRRDGKVPVPAIAGWTADKLVDWVVGYNPDGVQNEDHPSDITIHVGSMTPEMAKFILDNHNTMNRPLSKQVVRRYVRDLERGNWQLNGMTLKFAADGTLVDGQHRLQACWESGIAFDTYIVIGLDKSAFPTLDNGEVRGFNEYLRSTYVGLKFYGFIAGATTHLMGLEAGWRFVARRDATILDKAAWLDVHPDLAHSMNNIKDGALLEMQAKIPPSVILAVTYWGYALDRAKTDDFFSLLRNELQRPDGSQIQDKHGTILNLAGGLSKIRGRKNGKCNTNILPLVIAALYAYIDGYALKRGWVDKLVGEEGTFLTGLLQTRAHPMIEAYQARQLGVQMVSKKAFLTSNGQTDLDLDPANDQAVADVSVAESVLSEKPAAKTRAPRQRRAA